MLRRTELGRHMPYDTYTTPTLTKEAARELLLLLAGLMMALAMASLDQKWAAERPKPYRRHSGRPCVMEHGQGNDAISPHFPPACVYDFTGRRIMFRR